MTTIHTPTRYRLNTAAFRTMAAMGLVPGDKRVELIDGELIEMPAIGSRHAAVVSRLVRWFIPRLGDRAVVSPQNPIVLDDYSQPQPDICLLRPRADFYDEHLPTPADVLLLIEVADSTLAYDRDEKLPLYARRGIVEAWLVDLQASRLVAHRQPGPAGYGEWVELGAGGGLAPLAFADLLIHPADLGFRARP